MKFIAKHYKFIIFLLVIFLIFVIFQTNNKDNQNYPYKPDKFFSFNERTPEKEKIFNKLLNN